MRTVSDAERRARIGVRHALAPSARLTSPEDVTRALVCLHSTEPPSVHLSCWARGDGVTVADVEAALYDTRTLVRQQAMRETLFVFPRDLVPAVWGSAGARVSGAHRRRLVKDLERWGPAEDGAGEHWLQAAEEAVLSLLADGEPRSSAQIRAAVPQADGVIVQAPDKSWGGPVATAPRVLAGLAQAGRLARAHNDGPWFTSRPTWTTTTAWWGGDAPGATEPAAGWAELVGRWLLSYGPGTVEDITWWLGGTKTAVRAALLDLDAREVALESGAPAWLHPQDLDPVPDPGPWVALLPLLDPTIMGWRDRTFFLGPHGPQLFDSIGNAGTTAWVDGRVVGAWVQDPDGVVELRLLEPDLPAASREALHAEARRLTDWLDGQRVFTVYPSPAMRLPTGP